MQARLHEHLERRPEQRRGLGGIVNNSRGIICAYKKPQYSGMNYAEAARAACIDMQQDLSSVIGKMSK